MKLGCLPYYRNLAAFVDGELPPEKAARVERHLRACEICGAEVRALRGLARLAPPPEIEPGADFDRVFWEKLAGVRRHKEPSALEQALCSLKAFVTSPAGLSLSVGCALAVFVLSLYLLRPMTPAGLPRQELMAAADLELYANFDVIENSEALEHFELIEMLDELQQGGQG